MPPASTYQGRMARLGGSSAAPRRAQAGTGSRARPGLQRGGPGGTAASCPAAMAAPAHAHPEAEPPPAGTRAGSGCAGSARAAEPQVPAARSPPPVPVAPGGAGAKAAQPQVICPQFRAEAVASSTAQQGRTRLAGGAEAARGLAGAAAGARPQAGRCEGRGWSWSREGSG